MDLSKIVLVNFIFIAAVCAICDKAVIPHLSFKLSGSNVAFPCDSTRNIYLSTGRFQQNKLIGTRIQICRETAIVTVPRFKAGVPLTLAAFSLKNRDSRPALVPFPCWSMQEEGNCNALQNAVDLCLDQADILWVLDIGIVNTLEQPIRRCAPKVVGINCKTGQVVKIIDLSSYVTSNSLLQYIQVEYNKENDCYIYISDAGTGAIIVYNVFANKGFRVVLPKAVSYGIKSRDVLYIVLTYRNKECLLFCTYLSGKNLFYIRTKSLQRGQTSGAVVDVGPKPAGTEIIPLGSDNGVALFFRYKGGSHIYYWNTLTCFKEDNFVLVQQGSDCTLATQVVPGYKKLMWTIESNLQDYVANTIGCLGATMKVHPLVKTSD